MKENRGNGKMKLNCWRNQWGSDLLEEMGWMEVTEEGPFKAHYLDERSQGNDAVW